jgi:hypothetical protein
MPDSLAPMSTFLRNQRTCDTSKLPAGVLRVCEHMPAKRNASLASDCTIRLVEQSSSEMQCTLGVPTGIRTPVTAVKGLPLPKATIGFRPLSPLDYSYGSPLTPVNSSWFGAPMVH